MFDVKVKHENLTSKDEESKALKASHVPNKSKDCLH